MFNSKIKFVAAIALVIMVCTAVSAENNVDRKSVGADKARYQKLLRQIQDIDSEYGKILAQAVDQTKNDGKASLELKSQLITLRERRDRCINRLMLISLRHGWKMPTPNMQSVTDTKVPSEKEQLFESADKMIQEKFAQEAQRIADAIALPIISLRKITSKGGK